MRTTLAQSRRRFLTTLAGSAAPLIITGQRLFAEGEGAANQLRVAVMGLGRGLSHVKSWMAVPNCRVVCVCDPDSRRLAEGGRVTASGGGAAAVLEPDIRKVLERKDVDVLSIAAPNFWQTPAAILACQAGKHVYVEKPGSHNAAEAGWIGQAAEKYGRKVQFGTQRRSAPALQEAVARLKAGDLGEITAVRCVYSADRKGIGNGKPAPVPDWLRWDLWQGPVPDAEFRSNLVHYNWHWFWNYGGGELANNGVHALDLALWGLGQPAVRKVTCNGGKYAFVSDDQETPDTAVAVFDFDSSLISLDSSSRHRRKGEPDAFVSFYGEGGILAMSSSGYRMLDADGKEIANSQPSLNDVPHFKNLADAIRTNAALNAPIAQGQQAAQLCHLANIAYRTRNTLEVAADGSLKNAPPEAQALWARKYRDGWAPKV